MPIRPIEYPHLRSERGEAYYLDHQYEKALLDYEAALSSVDSGIVRINTLKRKHELQALLARMPEKKPLTGAGREPAHHKPVGTVKP
jgi:hypothetical protein